MKYAKTILEVAGKLPRLDGGEGMGTRQAAALLAEWKIKKTSRGWPIDTILKAAKEYVEREPKGDELDSEIKRRKIKLLDLEIGKAEDSLVDVADVVDAIHKRDAELAMRITTLKEAEIAKHPQHRDFVEKFCRAVLTRLSDEVDIAR